MTINDEVRMHVKHLMDRGFHQEALEFMHKMQPMVLPSAPPPLKTKNSLAEAVQGQRRKPSPMDKLAMRMDWDSTTHVGFAFIEARIVADKAFVFIITNDAQAVTIESDGSLFPSDDVVTKIRLLLG